MALIKKINVGKAKIEIHSNTTPEESKKNLIKLYDVINEIADRKRAAGINVDDWFYTQEEINKIKKNNSMNLIYMNK